MAKYRINVTEVLEDGTEQPILSGPEALGQDFNGFTLITVLPNGDGVCSIRDMDILELMSAFASDGSLSRAAELAVGIKKWWREAEADAAD